MDILWKSTWGWDNGRGILQDLQDERLEKQCGTDGPGRGQKPLALYERIIQASSNPQHERGEETMRTPKRPRPPWTVATSIIVAAILLLGAAHTGSAAASTGPPGAPANPLANLIVPENEAPRIRVSWDPPDAPVSGYTVTRADGQIFQADGAATTYSDHAVEPGTAYRYSVTAHNAQGASVNSAPASASVPAAPSQPGELSASVEDPIPSDHTAAVTLSWTPATIPPAAACETAYPIDGYAVHRHDGASEEELTRLDADTTSFTDRNATFGVSYTYRVSAHSAVGSGEAAAVNTTAPTRPVGVPRELTANISNLDAFDGSITLQWQSPGEGPAVTGYRITRTAGNAEQVILADHHDSVSYVDDSASAAIRYSYTVAARSADNVSAETEPVLVEVPAPVTKLTATVVNGQVQLTWNPDQSGREVLYRVQRRKGDEEWRDLEGASGLVMAASHVDSTAESDVSYTYRVQSRTTDGGSAWNESEPVIMVSLPGRPASLTANVDGNDNVLAWTAPDSPFIDGYRVRHHTGDAGWSILAGNLAAGTLTHRHAGAEPDVTHHYGVQAYNDAGDGPWSGPASATRVTPPAAPQNVSAELDDHDIVLTWEQPGTVHVSGYTVRYQEGDAVAQESQRLPESQTSFRLADTTGDVTYRIAARAHNDAGDSPWSGDVEIMRRLPPSAPANFAVAVDESDIVLPWGAPETGTVDGYRVEYGEQDAEHLQFVFASVMRLADP